MITIQELKSIYDAETPFIDNIYGNRFKPYLSHLILNDEKISSFHPIEFYFTGSHNEPIIFDEDHPIYTCKRLPSFIWDSLPLTGLQYVSDTAFLESYLKKTLLVMKNFSPQVFEYVTSWISIIQWVELTPHMNGTLLTSSTFPQLPHCIFLSHKSLKHIPPNIISDDFIEYFLLENIFHEALHQQLSSTILFCASIHENYDANHVKKINIPWRGGDWEPDRIFHATFVYAHLLNFRIEFSKSNLCTFKLNDAIKEAFGALEYLLSTFPLIKSIFSRDGMSLFNEVHELALNSYNQAKENSHLCGLNPSI